MAGWLSLMVVVAVAGREAMRELNVFQLMEIRSGLGLVMLYPLIRLAGGFAALRTSRLGMHATRGLLHYAAQLGWFFALTLIPLGQVVSLEFTMPIWTAILAASFLGERMTVWKISAIALGLIGVFVIVRPATGAINPGQLIALAAAVGFGTSVAMMKSLTRSWFRLWPARFRPFTSGYGRHPTSGLARSLSPSAARIPISAWRARCSMPMPRSCCRWISFASR
jgi:drug/metabolite transporter (DMT)-like permease